MSCTEIVCGTGISGSNVPKPGDPDNNVTLSAVGVSGGINLSWTYPTTNPHAVAYVDVFRSDSAIFSTALKRARISGDFYFDRIGPDEIKTYYYWIQLVSINGTENEIIGPASATPSPSLQEVLEQLNGVLDDTYLSQLLRARLDKIEILEYDLGDEVSKRLIQNAAMGEALSAVQSETGQALTYIQEEITQRTSSDEALLTSVNTLAVGMADNAAAIVTEQNLRATADTALAADITTLYANVAGNTSSISNEATARADADSALSSTVSSVSAVANAKNKTFSQNAAPASGMGAGDLWFDTDDNNKAYRYSGSAWVETSDTRIAANLAAISTEATARADADTALTSSVTTLTASVASKIKTYRQTTAPAVGMTAGDLWYDSDDGNKMYRYDGAAWVATDDSRIASNVAAITTEATTRASQDAVLATQITTLQSQLSAEGSTGSAIVQAQTTANTAVVAAATAQTTANGATTTANTAVTNAATAQSAANAANSAIANITSDSVLDTSEKPSQRKEWDVVAAEKAGINSQASAFSITSENTSYNTAFQTLATYLNNGTAWSNGIPSWLSDANLAVNTTIVGATYRSNWAALYTARTTLLNAIAAKAKTLADTAQTKANTANTAAETAQTTADSKVKTFFQAAAPNATTIGDLWVDTDDNNRIYRWNGIAWIDAHDARISSTASTVTTLQTTVNGHTTAIQEQINTIDGLSAQYTLKVNNNGYISGFGLASSPVNGAPYSEFAILANTFKFGAPDGTKTPFAVVDTGGGVYKTLLNSDVIIGGNVDIANLNAGSLRNDVKLRLGDGIIDLDGAGEIRVYKSLSANADYVRLSAGELRFLRYINGSYQTYNYLSRLETGIANSGDTVTIPGYWKTQPRIMVSPAMLGLYKKDYGNQDQAIYCQALNIQETSPGSGQWVFDAKATLSLAASSGGMALNVSSGTIANNSFTTAIQTTPANCTSITPTFSLSSSRGNSSSQYYRRSVRWRVNYLNGTWVNGPWNTVAIGDQLGSVTASGTFTFPSSAAWQWRVEYEAFDSDGTVFGAISYTYSQSTCPASSGGSGTASYNSPVNLSIPFSVTGSGEIYKIDYVYAITVGMTYYFVPSDVTAHVFDLLHPTYNPNPHYAFKLSTANSLLKPLTRRISETQTVTGNNLTVSNLPFRIERMQGTDQYANVTANVAAADCYAVVYRRQIVSNSTTPSNSFILNSFSYSLTAAQVLATGSLNWIAIGE